VMSRSGHVSTGQVKSGNDQVKALSVSDLVMSGQDRIRLDQFRSDHVRSCEGQGRTGQIMPDQFKVRSG